MKLFSSTAPRLRAPLFPRHRRRILPVALSVLLVIVFAPVGGGRVLNAAPGPAPSFPLLSLKRIVLLRHSDTTEGSRCTITSDSLLDDYSSYVEDERFLVRLPQSKLFNVHDYPQGRGFADMRVEQNEEDVIVSFRLQPGASVSVSQGFNRLEINFLTNERAHEQGQGE